MKTNPNIHLASTDTCTGCSACVSVCPTGSISMKEDREGFLQPHIDIKSCIGCHKCEKTCPIITPIKIPTDFETQAYMPPYSTLRVSAYSRWHLWKPPKKSLSKSSAKSELYMKSLPKQV